ncbi:MAG: hypothetical protein HEP71_33305 [Roseivirga sp.]|nr:hypothetical protein [Roseivirga sp.]
MNYKSNLQIGTIYTSSATEILTGQLVVTQDGGRGTLSIIGLDENDNETILGCASIHAYNASDAHVPCNTVSVLSHAGNRYKFVLDQTNPTVAAYAYFDHI